MPNVRLLDLDEIQNPVLKQQLQRAIEHGAPDPNFFRIMGHNPELAIKFFELWMESFNRGAIDHKLKEIIRVKMGRHVSCTY